MRAAKKKRIEEGGRTFQKQWAVKYFFVAHAENALCLICKKSISVIKDYNLKRHYQKNHEVFQPPVRKKRTQKIEKLPREFLAQQKLNKSGF